MLSRILHNQTVRCSSIISSSAYDVNKFENKNIHCNQRYVLICACIITITCLKFLGKYNKFKLDNYNKRILLKCFCSSWKKNFWIVSLKICFVPIGSKIVGTKNIWYNRSLSTFLKKKYQVFRHHRITSSSNFCPVCLLEKVVILGTNFPASNLRLRD